MFVTMTAMMRVPVAACDYVRGKSRRGIRRGAASSWRTRHSRPRRIRRWRGRDCCAVWRTARRTEAV